ncbi:cytochrome c biogenesis protein CcsA [soil metagenome]
MEYIGEHLLPGQVGHFLAILSLVASLIASVAYFKANKLINYHEKKSWLRFARIAFLIETIAVIGIFLCLYHIISNHYHEYYYAWNHSSRSLQPQYLLASFWEGQEGSFMLWNFWHCVLGWMFIWRNKKWEAPVMTVISFAQFCIATMLLGIYLAGLKLGNNPFILFRHQMGDIPLFNNPDYLNFPRIKEGNDLNTLLQNYWMVIHPPVLFLGFASTIIPFGFAYGGLVNKDHSWTKSSLAWTCFSAAALGTGVMMGAAWAYESLSFGGYWAWDPVENASMVPWLILIAGLHTNLIYNHSGYSLKSSYFFAIVGFILVLYSTFLTRTGILGDTSVHAFTGADMTEQLYLFLNIFIWMTTLFSTHTSKEKYVVLASAVVITSLYFVHPVFALASCLAGFGFLFYYLNKYIPSIKKEESTYSREFWMFIGALVFFLSAIIITYQTSLPVINSIFDKKHADAEDREFSYNQIQIFIAIIIGILTAVTQYLKYKDTPRPFFYKKILAPTVISLAISLSISFFGNINYDKHGLGFLAAIHIAIFGAVYAIVANAMYLWIGLKGKLKAAGASIAHVGFSLFLLGVLISSGKKKVLSENTTGISVFEKTKDQDPAENITLFKGIRTDMGLYHVTYLRDTANEFDRKKYFEIKFESKDGKDQFYLYPDVLKNNKGMEGFAANPDKQHYIWGDIFGYATSWVGSSAETDTSVFRSVGIKKGDSTFYSNGIIVLNDVVVNPEKFKRDILPGETPVMLDMTVISKDGRQYPLTPGFAINMQDSSFRNLPDTVIAQSLVVRFDKLGDETNGNLQIGIKETSNLNDLMTLKVYEFPMIALVWIGIIVMVIGLIMSIIQRIKKVKLTAV